MKTNPYTSLAGSGPVAPPPSCGWTYQPCRRADGGNDSAGGSVEPSYPKPAANQQVHPDGFVSLGPSTARHWIVPADVRLADDGHAGGGGRWVYQEIERWMREHSGELYVGEDRRSRSEHWKGKENGHHKTDPNSLVHYDEYSHTRTRPFRTPDNEDSDSGARDLVHQRRSAPIDESHLLRLTPDGRVIESLFDYGDDRLADYYDGRYPRPEKAAMKCEKCQLEIERIIGPEGRVTVWKCPDCDPDKGKDDLDHRDTVVFMRGTGEEVADEIPAESLAEEKRLNEIKTHWISYVEILRKRRMPEERIRKLLMKDQRFRYDALDYNAIDTGKKLENKMRTKRTRDLMKRIVTSSILDPVHPDLDWAQLLKPGSKELKQFRSGGTFLVVKRDRYRLYRLGPFDMPPTSTPLGIPISPTMQKAMVAGAFQKLLDDAIEEARKAARRRHLDEDEAAERTFEQFKAADVVRVMRVRSPKCKSCPKAA